MIRRCRRGALSLLGALIVLVVSGGIAGAQSSSPSPARGPTVSGQVTGGLSTGSRLVIRVDATMPGGWQALHLVEVSVMSTGRVLEALRFDIEDNKLTIGEANSVIVGTGSLARGDYLEVSGAGVVLTTGGANLSFEVNAKVIQTIPQGATFRLGVVDDLGGSDEVTRTLAEPRGAGITWGTVVALIAAALFAGGFVGNLFASKRRPPPRASVYDAVQRKLEADRAGKAPST
ncbi:MAG: hypothetical protein WB297_02945 [Actinomycetota bacterium]